MIDFTNAAGQAVAFSGGALYDPPVRSWAIWFNQDTRPTSNVVAVRTSAAGVAREVFQFNITTAGHFRYQVAWSGSIALFNVATDILPADGNNHLLIVTYDGTSISNDPVFEVDNVNKTITGETSPVGSISTGEDSIQLGFPTGAANSIDGKILMALRFNRILSRADKDEIFYSKLAIPSYRGLVFAPDLNRAALVTIFDGAVLGGTNMIKDHITGAVGTPSGSPIARGDNYLTYNNMT